MEIYMKLLAFYNHFPFWISFVCVCNSVLRFSQHVHCKMCLCICDDSVCMHTFEMAKCVAGNACALLTKVYAI